MKPGGTRCGRYAGVSDSVAYALSRLSTTGTSIAPASFVGQSAGKVDAKTGVKSKGQTQKEQSAVLQSFRSGIVNTLVCTCIGEEGLDVGEVDLIIHYDVVHSAIRNIQRSGRTGRKRAGCVLQLVMAGQEEIDHQSNLKKQVTAERTLKSLAKGNKLALFSNDAVLLSRAPKIVDAQFSIPLSVPQSAGRVRPVAHGKGVRRRRERGLSTQENEWMLAHGYENAGAILRESGAVQEDGEAAEEGDGSVGQICLHRHPDFQGVPTTTHVISHSKMSLQFVASMLRLNHCRSGSYEAERQAYARAKVSIHALSQESQGLTQGSCSQKLSQRLQGLQGQVRGSREMGYPDTREQPARGKSLCEDAPAEIDSAQSCDDDEVVEEVIIEESAVMRELEQGDEDCEESDQDELEGLSMEDLDEILGDDCKRDVDTKEMQLSGDMLLEEGANVSSDGDSGDDIFAAYNGKSMFQNKSTEGGMHACNDLGGGEMKSASELATPFPEIAGEGNHGAANIAGGIRRTVSESGDKRVDNWEDVDVVEETMDPAEWERLDAEGAEGKYFIQVCEREMEGESERRGRDTEEDTVGRAVQDLIQEDRRHSEYRTEGGKAAMQKEEEEKRRRDHEEEGRTSRLQEEDQGRRRRDDEEQRRKAAMQGEEEEKRRRDCEEERRIARLQEEEQERRRRDDEENERCLRDMAKVEREAPRRRELAVARDLIAKKAVSEKDRSASEHERQEARDCVLECARLGQKEPVVISHEDEVVAASKGEQAGRIDCGKQGLSVLKVNLDELFPMMEQGPGTHPLPFVSFCARVCTM